MRKKKKPASHLEKSLKFIAIAIAVCVAGFACLLVSLSVWVAAPRFFAERSVAPMRSIQLPQDAEFLSFEMQDIGGSSRWIAGQLYFASDLPEEGILDFFGLSSAGDCSPEGLSFGVTNEGVDDDGRTIYRLCRLSDMYD